MNTTFSMKGFLEKLSHLFPFFTLISRFSNKQADASIRNIKTYIGAFTQRF